MTDLELKQWREDASAHVYVDGTPHPYPNAKDINELNQRILHLLDLAEAAKEMTSWYGDHQIKDGVGFTGCDEGKKARTFLDTWFGGKG